MLLILIIDNFLYRIISAFALQMSYVGSFHNFIQSRDAAGLQVFMTNEQHLPSDHIERNNRALFEACRDGAEDICEVLIIFGADVNSAVVGHQTPLFIACENAHPVCVDLLLSYKTDLNAGDLNFVTTPLMATADQVDIPDDLTLDQFIDNRCRCMRSMLLAGAAIDQTDCYGTTALMWATWNFRLTEILIEEGANVNTVDTNEEEHALHFASRRNNADVMDMLLKCGADINAANAFKWTALHWACYQMYPAVVESLLRHAADIDIVDHIGLTALQLTLAEPDSPNRVAVLQLMATYAQTRLEASSADWIRLARNERIIQH